jgi:hypothetical protein
MIASSWWKVGLGMVGAAGIFASSGAGCSSEPSGSGGSSGGDTTSSGSGGGTGGGGTGGDTTTTGSPATTTTTSSGTTTGSGTTTTTGGGSSTSSTGTGSNYVDCQACTDDTAGAPANECNTAHDACFGNKNCAQIYNCAYDPGTGCATDASGACCTYACFDALKATLPNDPAAVQLAIDQYKAYDGCLYCTTCKSQCTAEAYCTAFAMGPAGCVN